MWNRTGVIWTSEPKLIQVVSPETHQLHAFQPELRTVGIGGANFVFFLMGELAFDRVWVELAGFVKAC